MGWPFRRHRGSQSGNLSPVVNITMAPGKDPDKVAWDVVAALAGRRPPEPLTARQVLTAVLADVPDLDGQHDYVMSLVDDILLGLTANGLTVVASGDVE